jgi:hypothetical protein
MADCMIPGNGDIIGPGIRISFYIQSFLAIIRAFTLPTKEAVESIKLGLVTSLALLISALVQYKTKDLHDIFLIEVIQLITLFMSVAQDTIFAAIGLKKSVIVKVQLWIALSILVTCFQIWFWVTIKQRLPNQACGNLVRIYAIVQLNPIGGLRIFALIVSCWNLIGLISFTYRFFKGSKFLWDFSDTPQCPLCIFMTLFMIPMIISIEMTAQKNPISGIWDWNFGQIMVMVLALMDVISLIIYWLDSEETD